MSKFETPRNPDGTVDLADIRRRCKCAMRNTATGVYLSDVMKELESARTEISLLQRDLDEARDVSDWWRMQAKECRKGISDLCSGIS